MRPFKKKVSIPSRAASWCSRIGNCASGGHDRNGLAQCPVSSCPTRQPGERTSRRRGGTDSLMKQDYDFRKGIRGKFSRRDPQFNLPVYLDADVQAYLAAQASQKGIPVSDLVNDLLQRDIALIESAK